MDGNIKIIVRFETDGEVHDVEVQPSTFFWAYQNAVRLYGKVDLIYVINGEEYCVA